MKAPDILNLIFGEVIGLLAILLIVYVAVRLDKRRRKQRDERPPRRKNLLRPPGHILQQRIEHLREEANDSFLKLFAAGLLFGLSLVPFIHVLTAVAAHREAFLGQKFDPKVFMILAGTPTLVVGCAIAAVLFFRRMRQLHTKIRNCSLGLRGEQAVAEALQKPSIIAAGYTSFHDVPGDGDWNIDHVVVGPSGIFVIETKTRSRRKPIIDEEDHIVRFDGEVLQFPWCRDVRTVRQVQYYAQWMRKFIHGYCPDNLPVQPLIVVPGWMVISSGNFPVKAMPEDYLEAFFTTEKPKFTPDQLRALRYRFDERCRNLEF